MSSALQADGGADRPASGGTAASPELNNTILFIEDVDERLLLGVALLAGLLAGAGLLTLFVLLVLAMLLPSSPSSNPTSKTKQTLFPRSLLLFFAFHHLKKKWVLSASSTKYKEGSPKNKTNV